MALDLLVRGVDKVVGYGLTEDQSMRLSVRKGSIVDYWDAGTEIPSRHLQGRQVSPGWCVIRSDVTPAQVDPYLWKWRQDLDWLAESLNTATDEWHGEVFATAVRTRDDRGAITRQQAENYLLAWNLHNLSFSRNKAAGDFTIYDLATSQRFWWPDDITGVTFSELGYDEATGQHQIRLSYGGIAGAGRRRAGVTSVDQKILGIVAERAEVERHNVSQNRIDFNVWRGIPNYTPTGRNPLPGDDMIATLKQATAEELDQLLGLKRWRVKPAVVDAVIAGGGFVELTPQDLQASMQDFCHA